MRRNSPSLITEASSLRLPKINATQKNIDQENKRPQKKDRFYVRPQIRKILFSPFEAPQKTDRNLILLESTFHNKPFSQLDEFRIQKNIQLKLNKQTDRVSSTQRNKMLVGKQALSDYYQYYRKLNKLMQKASGNKQNNQIQQKSPQLAILQKSFDFGILPMCLGIVKFQGDSSILNLNNYNLGDKYIISMSAGLKQAKLIQKCYVSGNRITDNAMDELIKSLGNQVSILDLSYNKLTRINDDLLSIIVNPETRLEQLSFQKNKIRSKETIQSLLNTVMISKHLKVLNLRENGIGLNSADVICDLIQRQTVLQQLYIGKNYLSAIVGQRLFQMLVKNKNIKVFDYSLNNLGDDISNECAKSIATCLTKNTTLHHVDLSFNNFNLESSKIISEGLQPNKQIYGFHFGGNYGYIDSKGFLIIQQKQVTTVNSLVESKIHSYDIRSKRKNITITPKNFKNICWICEGWSEQQFRFEIPQDYSEQTKLVYIHFDFQQFTPRLINITDRHIRYTTMVPPIKYRYFFSFDHKQYLDKTEKQSSLQFVQNYTYEMYHEQTSFNVMNISERKGKSKKIINDWKQIIIRTLPRNTGLVSKKIKEQWNYSKSIWAKQWKLDNDDLIKKCFQKDWKCSKLMNLVKNQTDQDKLKQKLSENYQAIKLIYRYFASWSPFSDIWAVSNSSWTQFCQQSKIINKDTPLKITDLTFITTNSMSGADWKGNQLVPQRGLVRFQFMEALVRLAQQKYKKNGLTDNFTDSIVLMLKDHVLPLALLLQNEKWRAQKYFTQQNDCLIKKYRPIFTFIYKRNSKLKLKPGQKPFMCLAQFKSILQKANLTSTSVIQRDIFLSFNFAMMTQIDELQNQRFIKMTEIQFIQALARCAFVLPKTCSLTNNICEPIPIHYKYEWLINQLKISQCNQQIKGQFPDQGSIFDQKQQQ